MAENTGQRSARPMPLKKIRPSSSGGVMRSLSTAAHNSRATVATQSWVQKKKRLRSRMSAMAPLGRPSRNTGRVDAVCTSATQIGVGASEVIIQAAATSFIHIDMLAASQVNHNIRNTG